MAKEDGLIREGIMRGLFLAGLFAVALTGCTSVNETLFPGHSTVFSTLSEGLASLYGQPQQTAFDKLGFPDDHLKVGNTTVYTWSRTSISTMDGAPITLKCTIKIPVENKIIGHPQFDGNAGACLSYAQAFGPAHL